MAKREISTFQMKNWIQNNAHYCEKLKTESPDDEDRSHYAIISDRTFI